MTHQELNNLFTSTNTRPIDFIKFCKSHNVKISESTISQQRSGLIGIGAGWQLGYRCFFSQCQKQDSAMKPRYFRLAYTKIENSIERKPLSECDPKQFRYGGAIEDGPLPAITGFETVQESYRPVVERLNMDYSYLYHWIDTEQPDENGNFAY